MARNAWMREIVAAEYRDEGWWAIVLGCGHALRVLYGWASPQGERVICLQCVRELPEAEQQPLRTDSPLHAVARDDESA